MVLQKNKLFFISFHWYLFKINIFKKKQKFVIYLSKKSQITDFFKNILYDNNKFKRVSMKISFFTLQTHITSKYIYICIQYSKISKFALWLLKKKSTFIFSKLLKHLYRSYQKKQ